METIIGQLYSFGRNVNDIRIVPFHFSINSRFRMCVYFVGCAKIFIYEIHESIQNEKVLDEMLEDLECATDEKCEEKKYKLKFVKSLVLPFPVYFIVNTGDSLWAVSHECQSELKVCDLNEDKTHSSREDVFLVESGDKPMDVDLPLLPEKSLIFKTDSNVTKAKSKRNPICSVSQFSGALAFCRRNSLQNCWTIEILLGDKKLFEVFDVPFVTSPIDFGITTQKCTNSDVFKTDLCRNDNHNPVLLCVEAEDEENSNRDYVLKKGSFESFFGSGVSSNVVILIGLPDGRILWSAIAFNACNGQFEQHLLCNVEQPVSSIYIKKHKMSGESCDFIVIIGLYGKVMILAPDASYSNGIEELDPSFIVNTTHIPSPIDIFCVCDKGILHATSGGPLWVSNLSFQEPDSSDKSRGKKFTANSQQLNFCGFIHVLHLDNGKGLTICVASDGSVYAGSFFEGNSKSLNVTQEEIPVLLKSIYHYGDQLQQLEMLAQKQRKLFSAVATAAKLKFQGEKKVKIVCSVTEIEAETKKFIIAVEFQNLNELCLDTELWHLSASISSTCHLGVLSLNQCIPWNKGKCCLNVEVDPEMFACNSFSIFPLLVEAGLLLSIPTEWQSLGCFQSVVSLMPIYVEIESVLVHELYVLKACKSTKQTEILTDSLEMKEYSGIKTILSKIASTKASAAHFQFETEIKSFALPQKFSFLIFNSSVQSLLKTEVNCLVSGDADIAENFFRYLTRHSHLNLTSKDSLVCLNYPVSINVCSKETFICVTVSCSSFPLLVGLKASIVEMLKGAYVCKASDKSISISSEILGTLQSMSTKISKLLCENTHEISPEDIAVYKKLRDTISSNLYLL